MSGKLVGPDLRPDLEHDDGANFLTHDRMRDAQDRAVSDVGVLEERCLNLGGVDVLTTSDDDVLGAIHDVEPAVLIDPGHIAGVHPPIGERQRCLLWPVPVPPDDVRSSHPQLAGHLGSTRELLAGRAAGVALRDDGDVDDGDRLSHAVGTIDIVGARVHRCRCRGLRHAVAVARLADRECLCDPAHQLWRGRCASVGDIANARHVARWKTRGVEDLHDHCRDAAEGRDLLSFDELERSFRIELSHHHDLSPGGCVDHEDRLTACGMEERHAEQVGVRPPCAGAASPQLGAAGDEEQVHEVRAAVAMRSHRALRSARRPRGVEDRGVVVRVELGGGQLGDRLAVVEDLREQPDLDAAGDLGVDRTAPILLRDEDDVEGSDLVEMSRQATKALCVDDGDLGT